MPATVAGRERSPHMLVRSIPTMGGVTSKDQPAGVVMLTLNEAGDTIADLMVADGTGGNTTVHLEYSQLVRLALAAGLIADSIG
jgi:hypothetical protein